MSAHDVTHDELLAEIVTADGDSREAFERSELASCVACRATFEEQLELCGQLDALGVAERAALQDAFRGPAPAAGRAEAALRARILQDTARAPASTAGERAPRGSRTPASARRPWAWAGLAAAAALVVLFLQLQGGDPPAGPPSGPSPDVILGETFEVLGPVGEVDLFDTFRWRGELPPGGWYQVVLYARTADGGFEERAESDRLSAPSWTPAAAVLADLPREIRWTVQVYRGSGQGDLVDSVSTRARRRD